MIFPTFPTRLKEYREYYRLSCEKQDAFWESEAKRLLWRTPFSQAADEKRNVWFRDGKLNACENALDRHVQAGRGAQTAIVEMDAGGNRKIWSYQELLSRVEQTAAGLQDAGMKAGDVIAVFLPSNAAFFVAMLAISRIGAVSLPLSRRFSTAFALRVMEDARARMLMTQNSLAPQLLENCRARNIPVVDASIDAIAGFGAPRSVEPVPVDAESTLFLMYPGIGASNPRGYVYATGGYLTQVQLSGRLLFHSGEASTRPLRVLAAAESAALIFLSYAFWGALLSGDACLCVPENLDWSAHLADLTAGPDPVVLLTTPHYMARMRENIPKLPHEQRFHTIAFFGDAVTPRQLRQASEELAQDPSRVLNLWTSAQTGCSIVSTLPHPELCRPGALGLLMPGVTAAVLNDFGKPCGINESGQLVFTSGFPACARTILGQAERFHHLHLDGQGHFLTHDGVRQDSDGFFWFMKRLDDIVKVDGASVSTSEVESILQSHAEVREAAVIGVENQEEGDCIVAFVAPKNTRELENPAAFEKQLRTFFEDHSGGFQVPVKFAFVREMPRTRSGKVERRLLHRIAANDLSSADDLGHLMNPDVIQDLMQKR